MCADTGTGSGSVPISAGPRHLRGGTRRYGHGWFGPPTSRTANDPESGCMRVGGGRMVAVGRHHLRPGKDGLGLLHIAVERRQGGAVNGRSISRGRTRRGARAAASLTACLLVSLALAESAAAATRAPALRL